MVDDAEEVREILSVVSAEVPKLLSALSESLFGGEATTRYAQAVADFYKSLREAGMDEEAAYQLTRDFMDKTNLGGLIQEFMGARGKHGGGGNKAELRDAIEDRVREAMGERGLLGEEE